MRAWCGTTLSRKDAVMDTSLKASTARPRQCARTLDTCHRSASTRNDATLSIVISWMTNSSHACLRASSTYWSAARYSSNTLRVEMAACPVYRYCITDTNTPGRMFGTCMTWSFVSFMSDRNSAANTSHRVERIALCAGNACCSFPSPTLSMTSTNLSSWETFSNEVRSASRGAAKDTAMQSRLCRPCDRPPPCASVPTLFAYFSRNGRLASRMSLIRSCLGTMSRANCCVTDTASKCHRTKSRQNERTGPTFHLSADSSRLVMLSMVAFCLRNSSQLSLSSSRPYVSAALNNSQATSMSISTDAV
eukprot:comp19707_c3_seq1/m.23456 comp19707_c3_seq1/g.23456  ORF comp19707_c3_seq1/g.23456 comp19707_c3_seq1/m.23456 type:complete len:306 (+) comp19707_c3_seq1:1156-2073(+)